MYLETHKKPECYGCKACADVCPTNSIVFENDPEGFCYPVIHTDTCVNCGLCKKCCPNASDSTGKEVRPAGEVYIGVFPDYQYSSSSGGAFSALADHFLSKNGMVVGAAWATENGKFYVRHALASSEETCGPFRKSKYVLSDPADIYKKTETCLKGGSEVLFSGTPCQCSAVTSYLESKKVSTEKLVTVEIICHGAPNAQLFNSYLEELSDRKGKKVLEYQFRCKKEDADGKVNSRRAMITYDDHTTQVVDSRQDPFLWGYYSRLFYRPSCKTCRFAQPERYADITLGDAWGIEKVDPGLDPLKGVSMVIPNTEKGRAVVEATDVFGGWKKMPYSWAVASNEQLRKPTGFHMNREKFFRLRQTRSFYEAVEASKKVSFIKRVERGISRRIKKERS